MTQKISIDILRTMSKLGLFGRKKTGELFITIQILYDLLIFNFVSRGSKIQEKKN